MNIAETIKDKCKNNQTLETLIRVSGDFAIDKTDTHNGLTFDFIDGSILTVLNTRLNKKGFLIITQDKRV